jgi:hypothetical protein
MKKKLQNNILPLAAVAMVFGTASCTSIESKIVGEWYLDDADGDLFDALTDDDDYRVHFEFHPGGDFEFQRIVDRSYKYCYLGEWEYDKDDKEIKIEFGKNDFMDCEIEITIDEIDGDDMEGEMIFDYDGDDYKGDFEFERVY